MAIDSRLLIVCDPTQEANPVLDRVASIAKLGIKDYQPDITLLLAVDYSRADSSASNEAMYGDLASIDKLLAPLKGEDIVTSLRLSWSDEWAESILYSAEATKASSILVSAPREKSPAAFNDEFWHLVRNTQVPVAIIQSIDKPKRKNIVVAVDLCCDELQGLNQRVVKAGFAIAEWYGVEIHLVAAYPSSDHYPDRAKILEMTNLPNERLHLRIGKLDEALADLTDELDTDLLIVGAARRTGIKSQRRGRKLSSILCRVSHDLLFVV